jgi:hypothetical protein
MHLTPGNACRVVEAALFLTGQPPLTEAGDSRADAQVFAGSAAVAKLAAVTAGTGYAAQAGCLAQYHLRREGNTRRRRRSYAGRRRIARGRPVSARSPMRRRQATGDPHRLWLELVDTDGPFLALRALRQVWPSGMPPIDIEAYAALADAKPAFEKAWESWDSPESLSQVYREHCKTAGHDRTHRDSANDQANQR